MPTPVIQVEDVTRVYRAGDVEVHAASNGRLARTSFPRMFDIGHLALAPLRAMNEFMREEREFP